MMALKDHVPDVPCSIMAFFVLEFVTAQVLMVMFIAANAFFMVVKEKKIQLGKYDWRLLVCCFGGPAVFAVVWAALGALGPGGQW